MADGFILSLQKALRAALVNTTGVTNIVSTRVYDEPPQDVTFPYVRFGDITPSAFDTDTKEGAIVTVSIEGHSRSPSGRVEAAKIAEAIKSALHRKETALSVQDHKLVELIFETFQVTRNTEGRGHTAVIVFQAMLEETA